VSEPRTHYQISLTARQAVGLFVGLLAALGLAFFFGLMAASAGRSEGATSAAPEKEERAAAARPVPSAAADAPPPVETGVSSTSAAGAPPVSGTAVAVAEPTPPATIRTFEDSAEEEAAASPTPGSRTSIAGGTAQAPASGPARPAAKSAPAASSHAAPTGEGIWIQAASLSSHDEAYALGARLSKHGYHAIVLPGSGPKGKVYRVRVGPYRTESEASHAVARLSRQENIREPWVVPEGK
jgi:cell division septation protein DedD